MEDQSKMAKKEQKKPSKKPRTKAAAPAKKAAVPKKKAAPKSTNATKSLSVAEFADMTYLTENGVMQWLRQGLLKGQQNAKGDWQIEASNLEAPNIKRLVR
jgi:phage antirepressor YoqD-like protein